MNLLLVILTPILPYGASTAAGCSSWSPPLVASANVYSISLEYLMDLYRHGLAGQMLHVITFWLDWFGVAVFATTGALVASRKQMDIIGFILLGTVTGIGGGTIRDTVLGNLPVFWINDPRYLITCVVVSSAAFFFGPTSRNPATPWFSASMRWGSRFSQLRAQKLLSTQVLNLLSP